MNSYVGALVRVGLLVYTFVVVLITVPRTSVPTNDSKTLALHVAAGVLGLLICGGIATGRLRFPNPMRFGWPIVVLAGWYVLAGVFSEHSLNSIPHLSRLGSLVLLYLAAAVCMRESRHVHAWMAAACIAVALSCLYAISQQFGLPSLPWDPVDQSIGTFAESPGTFGNPNFAGHAIVLGAVFAVYLTLRQPWALMLVAVFAVQLGFAIQRGAIVALAAAATIVLVAAVAVRLRLNPSSGALGVMAICAGIGAVAVGAAIAYFAWFDASPVFDNSIRLRLNGYANAATMIQSNPLFGVGPGSYVIETPEYWTAFEKEWFVDTGLMNQHVHADTLEIAVDGGLVAAFAFIALIVLGVRHGLVFALANHDRRASRQLGLAFAAFFVAFVVDGCFGFNFHIPVAASFLFIVAGAMEGVLAGETAHDARPRPRWPIPAALAAASVVVGIVGIRSYSGKVAEFDARRAVAARQYNVADPRFARAEELRPWGWTAPYRRGAAAQLDGRLDAARRHLERAVECNENYLPALTYLARVELALAQAHAQTPDAARAQAEDAHAAAEHALRLAPGSPSDLDVSGRIAYFMATLAAAAEPEAAGTMWERSYETLHEAVERAPKADAELLTMFAQSAAATGRREEAERAFAHAVYLMPDSEAVYQAYYADASKHGGVDMFAAVLASRIERTRAEDASGPGARWLARAIEESAGGSLADAFVRDAVARGTDDPKLWMAYADSLANEEDRRGFVELVRDHLVREHEVPLTARILAMAWSDERSALAGATKALIDAHEARAAADDELNSVIDRVEYEVYNAQRDRPGLAVAASNMARLRVMMGQPNRAVALFEKRYATMTVAERIAAIPQYAEALLDAGMPEEAEKRVYELIALDPDKAELRLLLARVLARAGRHQEAYDVYDLLLAIPNLDPAMRALLEREQSAVGAPK